MENEVKKDKKSKSLLWILLGIALLIIIICVVIFSMRNAERKTESSSITTADNILPPINQSLIDKGYLIREQGRHFNIYYIKDEPWTYLEFFNNDTDIIQSMETKHIQITYLDASHLVIHHVYGSPISDYQFYNSETDILSQWYRQAQFISDEFVIYPEAVETATEKEYYMVVENPFDENFIYTFEVDYELYFSLLMLVTDFSIQNNCLTVTGYTSGGETLTADFYIK